MTENTIKVKDFTILPGARHREDGDGSADEFFETYILYYLNNAIKNRDKITIDLDNTLGYASSFISELAYRIKEECKKHSYDVNKVIVIKSSDDINQIKRFWDEINKK